MQYASKERLEKQREKDRQTTSEHQLREEKFRHEKETKAKKKRRIFAIVGICMLFILVFTIYAKSLPGKYDEFAKCLTEKGAVMYGENWCQYTNAQKNMFGKSFKYINYEVKTDLNKRPTWVINGKSYETVQSFERLSALTGCKLN